MRDLEIDQEFYHYLPRHTAEEHRRLEEQILLDGACRDAIVVWRGTNIVVDGMERYGICREHHIEFRVDEKDFPNRAAVMDWMSLNQVGRRNLSGEHLKYHVGRVYNAQKGPRGGARQKDAPAQRVAEKVAEQGGVSERTVLRAGNLAAALDAAAEKAPELRDAVLNQGVKVPLKALKEIAQMSSAEAKQRAATLVNGTPTKSDAAVEPEEDYKPPVDGLGKVVHDVRFHGVFSDCGVFVDLLRQAKALESAVSRLSKSDGGCHIHFETLHSAFRLIKAELNDKIPMARCGRCKGEKTIEKNGVRVECDGACLGHGFVTKFAYENAKKK
jgi:hypothetical protein